MICKCTYRWNIARDGTEFTEAFARRGKRHTDCNAITSAVERLRRRHAAQMLNASGNKRKIEETLNSGELQDPDLVEFWSIDAEDSPNIEAGSNIEATTDLTQGAAADDQPLQPKRRRCIEHLG